MRYIQLDDALQFMRGRASVHVFEKIKSKFEAMAVEIGEIKNDLNSSADEINQPVIKCKDCKWSCEWQDGYYCRQAETLLNIKEDDFCSRAEAEK